MKKIMINLVIFFGVFIFVEKVSAANNTIYFDLTSSKFTTVYDELKPKLEQIQDILSNNPKGHKYAIFIGKDSSGSFINLALMSSTASYNSSDMYCGFYAFSTSVNRVVGQCRSYNSYEPYTIARYTYTSNNENSFNTLITQLSNDILLDWSSSNFLGYRASGSYSKFIDMNSFSFTNNEYNYFNKTSNFILPYAANVPIYNYYSNDYDIKIGDIDLPAKTDFTGYLEPSDNYVSEPYQAKGTIEFDSNISSFDIYVDKDDDLADLTYKLNYIDYNDYIANDISKAKLYTVMFYGLKNENGLYHWEMLDDCTNWDFPSEYCHVKSKFEQLESELDKDGYTVEGYIDFLNIFEDYETVRIVLRLDNALAGKIDYWDKNSEVNRVDVDVNYFGFDYSKNLSDSNLYRYIIFTTKELDVSGGLYIISESEEISINYFDTKYAAFREYSSKAIVKKIGNAYIFGYEHIGLKNNLGFYLFTEKNLAERLVYQFYTKPELYFSFNNSDTLDGTIYIDNTGNSTTNNIAIDPDELINYTYSNIDNLFENIKKFNEKINDVSQEIHSVIQYAYDSLNIYIKSFLISIFTVILVSATVILIRK